MAVKPGAVTAGLQGNYAGLDNRVLNVLDMVGPIPYKASSLGGIFTKAGFASTINSSSAVGTQGIDFPRNLVYQMSLTGGTASSGIISAGTFLAFGSLVNGNGVTEAIAFSRLAAASVPIQGTVVFQQPVGFSFSNLLLATASSTGSNSMSLTVGFGGKLGIPTHNINQTNPPPVPYAWMGTSLLTTTSHTVSSTANVFTVIPGPMGYGGISFSAALSSNSAIILANQMNR
jgi:hypothetical protein